MEPVQCRTSMVFDAGRTLTLYASAALDRPQPDIHRVLIVIHGTKRNADGYFRVAVEAARIAGKLGETLVIAPRFAEQGDRLALGSKDFVWAPGADWRAGDLSSREAPPRVSSFELMNQIVARLADSKRFPNLSTIVLAGHSAGGQFVQRYAIGEPDDPALAHLRLIYVVANPSSYLYLDARRPDPHKPGTFTIPDTTACRSNRFKYGFERPNTYFKAQPAEEMIARYRARAVVYLLGEADTNPNAANLSRTSGAMAQGPNRFARGKAFMAYMDTFYKPHAHRMVTVPGVGHSSRGMFQSPRGLKVLFAD
jgi:pimeloyl-ACP methyl ester carboxylesterase